LQLIKKQFNLDHQRRTEVRFPRLQVMIMVLQGQFTSKKDSGNNSFCGEVGQFSPFLALLATFSQFDCKQGYPQLLTNLK